MDNNSNPNNPDKEKIILDLSLIEDDFEFACSTASAISTAEEELSALDTLIEETQTSISSLTPNCDKLDYVLAVSSGALCGIIDIFLVAKPGESPLCNFTDKMAEEKVKLFAKLFGWKDNGGDSFKSALRFLEKKFKVPYDQTNISDSGMEFLNLTQKNHHFKSLSHNPSLLGLVFSILDQFTNTSHFVSDGRLAIHKVPDGSFELRGHTIPEKFFCAFVNWFGHIISDYAGSSGSKERGMGIPSPLWTWMNDVIAIKNKLHLKPNEFEKNFNDLALKLYEQGYDSRFQEAQAIPVFINELTVRLIYSIRRMFKYLNDTPATEREFSELWKACEPFSNTTVKRMLTVAHGTFCLIDIGEAIGEGFAKGGGYFNVGEFFMRLNIPGLGRFGISLYGEASRGRELYVLHEEERFLERKKEILLEYMDGLKILSEIYDNKEILVFIDDISTSDAYKQMLNNSIELARKRQVPEDKIFKSIEDIDKYFTGGQTDD